MLCYTSCVLLVTEMVLFRPSERPLTALDSSAPRLLRMAPLRHSLRVAPRHDAQDIEDTASTLSAPGCSGEDADCLGEYSGAFVCVNVLIASVVSCLVGCGAVQSGRSDS
jgi:hypothetical protein